MAVIAVDRWTVGYVLLAAGTLASYRPEGWGLVLPGYLALMALAVRAPALRARGGAAAFVGEFYALLAAAVLAWDALRSPEDAD